MKPAWLLVLRGVSHANCETRASKKVLGKEKWRPISSSAGEYFPGKRNWAEANGIIYRKVQFSTWYSEFLPNNMVLLLRLIFGIKVPAITITLNGVLVCGDNDISKIPEFSGYIKLKPEIYMDNISYAIWYAPAP